MRDNGPPGFTWRERERKKQNEPTAKPIACIFHGHQQLEPFFWSVRVTKQAKDESSPPLAARLRQRFPTAKTQTLKRMVEAGRVIVNGRRATRLNQPTEPGDVVTVDERPDSARSPRKVKSARAMLASRREAPRTRMKRLAESAARRQVSATSSCLSSIRSTSG